MFRLMLTMIRRSLVRRSARLTVTFASVAFATAALVVLASIMVAVGDVMIRNSVAIHTGHVWVTSATAQGLADVDWPSLDHWPHVRTVLPRKAREGMLRRADRQVGLTLYGVQGARERSESVVPARIQPGTYLPSPGSIVIGSATAERLDARVGDEIEFVQAGASPSVFRISGLFSTGIEGLDSRTAWVDINDVSGSVNELALFLDAPAAAADTAQALRGIVPSAAHVVTWREALPELVQLISLNQVSMNVVLVLALLILAFGVSNTAFMSITERTREMGILKAMGLRPWEVTFWVLAEMTMLVVAAGFAGVGIGAVAAGIWSHIGLDLSRWTSANPHFLVTGIVHPRTTFATLALPGLVAVACGVLGAILPAFRAGRINVIKALRWI
jgi:putative ABC transport system permease protein